MNSFTGRSGRYRSSVPSSAPRSASSSLSTNQAASTHSSISVARSSSSRPRFTFVRRVLQVVEELPDDASLAHDDQLTVRYGVVVASENELVVAGQADPPFGGQRAEISGVVVEHRPAIRLVREHRDAAPLVADAGDVERVAGAAAARRLELGERDPRREALECARQRRGDAYVGVHTHMRGIARRHFQERESGAAPGRIDENAQSTSSGALGRRIDSASR